MGTKERHVIQFRCWDSLSLFFRFHILSFSLCIFLLGEQLREQSQTPSGSAALV